MHIDKYIALLLSDKHFLNNEYKKYLNNGCIICNITGNVSANVLQATIRKAMINKKMYDMLADILYHVDNNSITHENFCLILKFRGKRKKTYLSNIAHANLAFYQMQIINRTAGSFEAFAWLFDIMCKYDFFTTEDVISILSDNTVITQYGIQSCIDSALQNYGESKKIEIATAWLMKIKTGDGFA